MKKPIIYILSGLILLSSCKKFLDQDPNSMATDQTTWKSEGDANASVAACYSLIRSAFNASITYYSYGDLPSDEFSDVIGGDVGSYQPIQVMNWGVPIPAANNYDPRLKLRLYTNFYTAIAQSNRCLHFINEMPASAFAGVDDATQKATKNKYLGEAYFTRAFNYFYIARTWGDVPLALDYEADVSASPQLPRVPQSQILMQAISDATIAASYLGWKDGGSPNRAVRADKGAAYALLAHIYAWRGSYDSCAIACDAVINSGSYNLTGPSNYMSIYQGQSDESIFEIAANTAAESQMAADAYTYTGVTLTAPYLNNGPSLPGWAISTTVFDKLFADTNDVRRKMAFVTLNTGGANAVECIKFANIQNVNNNPAYQIALNNTIVFRYADILLLKAEAMAAKTAPDAAGALALVNEVRARRSVDPITDLVGPALQQAITDERGRELFMEGHRFYDLIRLERLTGQQQLPFMTHSEFLSGKYYWPVDPSLFITNSKLTQTPYWIGKIK